MKIENQTQIISEIYTKVRQDLIKKEIKKGVVVFGGHPLRVIIDGIEQDFWSEFVRVNKDSFRTLVFRSITRKKPRHEAYIGHGIRSLIKLDPLIKKTIVIDQRSNMERELDPGAGISGSQKSDSLLQAYRDLLFHSIDMILTPVREGSLGPIEAINDLGPFSESRNKNNPHAWDIKEEIEQARFTQLALSLDNNVIFSFARLQIMNEYKQFALPLAQLITADLRFLDLNEIPENVDLSSMNLDFFNDVEEEKTINLGLGERKVEQVIAYPYLTKLGIIYVRLFRVWNMNKDEFEVVRVLQTKPSLTNIDGLRIDSSCIDGVHSLDCHCDCKAQLEDVLFKFGFNEDKNVVVIQMADHEGKGWGTVLKGSGQHRAVREFNDQYPLNSIDHVDAESHFYNALGVPPDNRSYGAAQAVIQFLDIRHVTRLLMDNQEKISALDAVALNYDEVLPVYPEELTLSREAKRSKKAKQNGKVEGANGPVMYPGKR